MSLFEYTHSIISPFPSLPSLSFDQYTLVLGECKCIRICECIQMHPLSPISLPSLSHLYPSIADRILMAQQFCMKFIQILQTKPSPPPLFAPSPLTCRDGSCDRQRHFCGSDATRDGNRCGMRIGMGIEMGMGMGVEMGMWQEERGGSGWLHWHA